MPAPFSEGERVYTGEVFELAQHSERLAHSAEVLDFTVPYSIDEIDQATRDVIEAMDIVDGYVRPVAWRGSEMMGVSAQSTRVNVAIAAWEWPAYFTPEARLEGIRMKFGKYRRPDPATRADQQQGGGPLHDLHPVEARSRGGGL